MEAYLRLKNISQEFENKLILKNVNFEISEGEFASISGPVSYTHLRAHET